MAGIWVLFLAAVSAPLSYSLGASGLISGAAATASSFVAPYGADRAADNSTMASSRWYCGKIGTKWLQLDLHGVYSISQWTVAGLGAAGWDSNCNLKDYQLLGSLDGSTWSQFDSVSGNSANSTSRTITPAAVRYVKLQITAGNQLNDYWASVLEFQVYGTALSTITTSAISGVTAPVTGATPVAAITETDQYTGTVAWSGNPATFAGLTSYAVTITLTPKAGYTLAGVPANFFSVNGATSVTNAAGSGVVTASFPATVADTTPRSSAKAITTFSISGVAGTIDETNHTIVVVLPLGTSVTNLTPAITVSDRAGVSPAGGMATDFTGPKIYTVTAEDGTTQSYTVTILTLTVTKDNARAITAFSVNGVPGTIDQANHTIAVTLPPGANITSLTPAVTVSDKASVSPASGVAQDFTNPVIYTATAEDGTTETYTVTVTLAQAGSSSQPSYIPRTLTDSATGITLTGNSIHRMARLTVFPLALHPDDPACDAIRKAQAAGQLIIGCNISLTPAANGSVTLSIPVGSRYDGRTVTILHCADGRLESIDAVVQGGRATFTVTTLSPFAVTRSVLIPETTVTNPPKTGDAAGMWGFAVAGLAIICAGFVVIKRRKA